MGFPSSWTEIYSLSLSLCSNFASHSTFHYLAKIKPTAFSPPAPVNLDYFVNNFNAQTQYFAFGLGTFFIIGLQG